MTTNGTRTILVAGGGTAGWMAAAALGRFVPPGWRVILVESDAIATVGVGEATIPQIRRYNLGLGIDENAMLRATGGTLKLGIQFDGWTRPGERYMHGFGTVGRGLGLIRFHHYWLRANALGIARPFGDHGINNIAALSDHVSSDPENVPYAFHFDAALYAAFLRRFAENAGVERIEGRIIGVERADDGDIAALRLEGDRRIAADLFLDCTGFRSLLLGQELGVDYIDWTHLLPCDRAVAVPSEPMAAPPPYTRAAAREAGWQWRIPLTHRTGNGLVYSNAHLSDDEAAATLLANLDTPALADPRPIRFTTGKRARFWERNCVAVGLASGFLEPLESTSIHLVQTAVARIMQFLPAGAMQDVERDEYNRLTHFEYDAIRDFLVLHYHANQRVGQPLWDAMRAIDLPPALAEKIALFRASGRISRREDELFAEPGWLQVMLGQGIVPDRWHPFVDALPPEKLKAFIDGVHAVAAQAARGMPAHRQFLAGVHGAGAATRQVPA